MKNVASARPRYQRATLSLKAGKHAGLSATVEITNGGLLSIAALVSTILLSTAILVNAAVKDGTRIADR